MEHTQTPDPFGHQPVDPSGADRPSAEPSKARKVLIGTAATVGAFVGSAALVSVAANAFQSSGDTPAVQQGQTVPGQAGQGQGQGQAGQGQVGPGMGQPPGRGQRPTAPGGGSSQQDSSGSGTRTVPQGPSMGVPDAGGPTSRSRAS